MEIRLKENLVRLLQHKGIKAADLARMTGIAPSVLSEWMSGRMPRGVTNLQKVAEELGVGLGDLCFGKPEPAKGTISPEEKTPKKTKMKPKDIFPLVLPIRESGILEFHVRWVSMKEENLPE